MINDEEICQFVRLIDFMSKLIRLLELRKKSREHFVKFGKVEGFLTCSSTSILFS